jgi:hypothetical protein
MIVRITLLLVSLPLLLHGAEGLYRTLSAQPAASPVVPAIEAAGGALVLLTLVFMSVRSRRRRTAATAKAAGEASEAAQARIASAIRRPVPEFRRLMLVNLSPYAALSALEEAPPLGAQAAVRSQIARVLPGITFNDHGLGQFNGEDHSILMDLGVEPQVWAATIDVTGEAAPSALRRLITQTGWRAYAPKLGRFITGDDLAATHESDAPAPRT